MHIEVQVALNFVISYLYNKLPRRRVNIFGEELERALKDKFRGHWYPEKPFKGSAFRCLKTGDPADPVLERAARESGVPIQDILENLPQELAVWVDPGEVSYRIGEKGAVKVLFSESPDSHDPHDNAIADREVTKTFNPEAQCFRPVEAGFSELSLSPEARMPCVSVMQGGNSPSPPIAPSPPSFAPRLSAPLTFTTAAFAQTKFGSTKLKTNSKRANRMSPTEFSNYIKQRAMQQQIGGGGASHHMQGLRSPSLIQPDHSGYFYPPTPFQPYNSNGQYPGPHTGVRYAAPEPTAATGSGPNSAATNNAPGHPFYVPHTQHTNTTAHNNAAPTTDANKLLDLLPSSYPASQYQHLLVAN
uniref:Putative anti-proliferation factor btg1/tob n=1 Tax=Xenopsylla cheopis TaxID=163159 RepID=A0A6M2DHA7_XENCH